MSRGKHWSLWLAATAAFVLIGCTWAFAVARYGGPDEPAHVIRAAAAAHGDLLGKPVDGLEPGYRQVTVPAPLGSGDPACYRHSATVTAECAVVGSTAGSVDVATSAGSAPPWYYVVVGLLARMLSSGRSVIGYRMAGVLCCSVILGYAVARAEPRAVRTWLLVALVPSSWFLIGVVGTSGIEIALVVLALVEAVNRFHVVDHPAPSILRVTVPLAVCLVLRPAAVIDVVAVALVVLPTQPRPFTRQLLARLTLPFIAAAGAWAAWTVWAGVVFRDRRTADTRSFTSALVHSLRGISTTLHEAIGTLGWNEFFVPVVAEVAWVAALAVGVAWVVTRGGTDRWWHAPWIAAGVLLPTVVEVIVHRRIGGVWQGRYSIPFAIAGVLYVARRGAPRRVVMRSLVCAAVVVEVLTLWHTLRRYMVGLDGSLVLRRARWTPPLNAWLLLAVNAAAMAWLVVVVLMSDVSDHVPEHVDDEVGRSGRVEDREPAVRAELEIGEVGHG